MKASRTACLAVSLSILLALPVLPLRASPRREDLTFSATDPASGAIGSFTFHYDDDGNLQYISGYAFTQYWQVTTYWSQDTGWTIGEVVINDPDAQVDPPPQLSPRRSPFGSHYLFQPPPTSPMPPVFKPPIGSPPVVSPSNPVPEPPPEPTSPSLGVSCTDCIANLREDCRLVALGLAGAAYAGAVAFFLYTCAPPASPAAPATAGASIAACAVVALGIAGVGVWGAKKQQKQCTNQAPITCSDPATGKPCYQLGYK